MTAGPPPESPGSDEYPRRTQSGRGSPGPGSGRGRHKRVQPEPIGRRVVAGNGRPASTPRSDVTHNGGPRQDYLTPYENGTTREQPGAGHNGHEPNGYQRAPEHAMSDGNDFDEQAGRVAVLADPDTRRIGAPAVGTQSAKPQQRGRPYGLFAVLALQAFISLTFIWSNTAFGDEANYLYVGRLELNHWLHGKPLPGFDVLSGAPLIYPPIGGLADDIGGLAGARILSLIFMLAATVLLYSTASRLLGRQAALPAAALWAVCVSALKLGAFATYDPMAVFLMCLSAWLVVQASFRRRAPELAVLAALAMLLSDLTAYSYGIYDLVLVAFAYFVWRYRLGSRRAWELMLWLLGAAATLAFIIPTAMGLWSGIVAVTITRSGSNENQGVVLVAELAWQWTGPVAMLALAGAFMAAAIRENKRVTALLAVLAASAFLVPIYQLHLQTGYSLDKHLACGIWFAAIPAGYLVAKVAARVPRPRPAFMALAGMAALAFPTVTGWVSTYSDYRSWANATQLLDVVRPLTEAPHTLPLYSGVRVNWILDYYLDFKSRGPQWGAGPQVNLDPKVIGDKAVSYYEDQLSGTATTTSGAPYEYSVVALQFGVDPASFGYSNGRLPAETQLVREIQTLAGAGPPKTGLDNFAIALEHESKYYQLVAIVPYKSDLVPGSYLIWKRTSVPLPHS